MSADSVVSRQRLFQIRQKEAGLCRLCPKKIANVNSTFCDDHAKKAREYFRKRAGYHPWHPGGKGRRPNWGKQAIAEIEASCGIEQKIKFKKLLDKTRE